MSQGVKINVNGLGPDKYGEPVYPAGSGTGHEVGLLIQFYLVAVSSHVLVLTDAERPPVRSHAERGNEGYRSRLS